MNTIINNSKYISFETTITLLSLKYNYHRIIKIKLDECVHKGGENKILCNL